MRVNGKIYRAVVLSTLLYGAEAWRVYRRQVNKLHAFMMRHLRSVMKITWMDKMTIKEILERTGLPSMEDLLIRKNFRWTGHLLRMSPDRLPGACVCVRARACVCLSLSLIPSLLPLSISLSLSIVLSSHLLFRFAGCAFSYPSYGFRDMSPPQAISHLPSADSQDITHRH